MASPDLPRALPREVDFAADRSASPERMNRAMSYLVAWLRRVEAYQPELKQIIDELRGVGLQRMAEVLTPIFLDAVATGESLRAIRDGWEADLLPAEVAARAARDVAQLLADYRHRWLGAHASAPTVDDVGAPVTIGTAYFDTTRQQTRVLSKAGWIDASSISADAVAASASARGAAQMASEAAASSAAAMGEAGAAAQSATDAAASANAAWEASDTAQGFADSVDPSRLAPKVHKHTLADVTDFDPNAFATKSHQHTMADISDFGTADVHRLGTPGRWFCADSIPAAPANANPNSGLYLVPFSLPGSYDAIGCYFGIGGTKNLRLGIYASDGAGLPAGLIEQLATIVSPTTGGTIVQLPAKRTLAAGVRWWLAIAASSFSSTNCITGFDSATARMLGAADVGDVAPALGLKTDLNASAPLPDLSGRGIATYTLVNLVPHLSLRAA